MSGTTPFVVIGVPTFRRPKGLRRLLDSLAKQEATFPLHVLVADNEGEGGAGLAVVKEVQAAGFPFPLTAIAVPERGISQARNALMEEGFGNLKADALAMVDDDEWAEPRWVAALVTMQAQTGADVVEGRVEPEFDRRQPAWMQGLSIYWRPNHPPGELASIEATTSVLLWHTVHTRFPAEKFDPAFSLSGGGDTEFFRRIKRHGATFAYAPDSVAHEFFGSSRTTRRWAIQRAFRNGNNHARILFLHPEPASDRILHIAKALAGIVYSTVMILVLFWSPRRLMKGILLFARQTGKAVGLARLRVKAYDTVHGS